MLAAQFVEAVATARTMAGLDHVARMSWRALAEGHIADAAAEAISVAVEARRARLKGIGLMSASKPPSARRRPAAPDKRASLERRRRCAMSGAVPAAIAAAFTLGEIAVLAVVAAEVKRRGRCELHIDAIAAKAGVCRTVVQNATREARRLGLIRFTERRRRGQRSDTNIIEIVALMWRSWLKIGGAGKGWVQKREHHEYQLFVSSPVEERSPRTVARGGEYGDNSERRAQSLDVLGLFPSESAS